MSLFLGFDTSNYTTSAAVFDSESGKMYSSRKLLNVAAGELGLRQSDALFAHIKQLPDIVRELTADFGGGKIAAAAASTRPRAVDGSYMPCFCAGEMAARVFAELNGIPFAECSHQQGHLMAAAWAAGNCRLVDSELLAFHLSGGTTELLHVLPGEDGLPVCERIGGSTDISAGQAIDRCGVMLGLEFPAGAELDRLAATAAPVKGFLSKQRGLEFSLSGLENKCREMLYSGDPEELKAAVARFAIESVTLAVLECLGAARKIYPDVPILMIGGVSSNSMLRKAAAEKFGAVFAPPEYSADNAAGVALIAAKKFSVLTNNG